MELFQILFSFVRLVGAVLSMLVSGASSARTFELPLIIRQFNSPPAVQNIVISRCEDAGFSARETAYVLAMCEWESRFDLYAANKTSSARGLFQFIEPTRKELARRAGVSAEDPFCVTLQFACLQESFKEAYPAAERQCGERDSDTFYAWVYAYHHDGPSYAYGGYDMAMTEVLPRMRRYEEQLRSSKKTLASK